MELTIKTDKTEIWEFDYGVLIVRDEDKDWEEDYSWDVWIDGDLAESFSTQDKAWVWCCDQKKNNYDRE